MRSQSKRYYSGWDPKLIRLTGDYLFKLNRDTYARASVGHPRARVRRRQRRGAVEAGRAELGARRSSSTTWRSATSTARSASATTTTRWRPATPRSTGTPAGTGIETAALGRPLSRRRLGRHARGVAALRQRLGGGRLRHQDRRHRRTTSARAASPRALTLSIPLRWATPFETRQTDQRQPDLARRATAARSSNIQNRLYPIVRDLDRNRLEHNWGASGNEAVRSALLAPAGARRLRQRRQGSDRAGGDRGGRRLLGAERAGGRRPPPRVVTRADIVRADVAAIQARLEADPSPTLMYAAAVERRLCHLRLGAAAADHPARRRRSPAPAASAPTCCRPGPRRPTRWRGRCRRRAGRRGCGGSTSCPPRGRRGEIVDLRLPLRAGGAGGDDHPAGALPGRADPRDLRRRRPASSRTCTSSISSGAVWRSLQWVGPKMDLVDLQILEPYTGD